MNSDMVIVPGSERRAREDVRLVGPADPNERLTVSVGVRRRPDGPPLPDLGKLGAQRPRHRTVLDHAKVAELYGADPKDLARVEDFARQAGLTVEHSSTARQTVVLTGTVDQMNKAFGVDLNIYEHQGGHYRSREGHVHVPGHLDGVIERVSGLTNLPLARPHYRRDPARPDSATALGQVVKLVAEQQVSSFNARQISEMYDFPTVSAGAGVCVGIIELGGGYNPADLTSYFNALGLPTPNVVAVSVDGAVNNYGDPSGADVEVELDIEVVGSIAPGATIAVYFAPNTEQGFIDAITTAAADSTNNPSIISISWGAPEDVGWTAAGLSGMDSAFVTAAVAGITVLAASGDSGSADGVGDGKAHCDYPASDPYVIACGGTTLQVKADGTRDEIVWNDPVNAWAGGGGVSNQFPLPSWQAGKGVPPSVNDGVSTGRGVPDIAANADPLTGFYVVADGAWLVVGGTSDVAPLYAGMLAVISSALGGRLGFITPYLYSLYSKPEVFDDIIDGTNQTYPAPGYSAGIGWDACSGLGRIDGNGLLANL